MVPGVCQPSGGDPSVAMEPAEPTKRGRISLHCAPRRKVPPSGRTPCAHPDVKRVGPSLLQQARIAQGVRGGRDSIKRQISACGYLHKAVLAISEIENPQHRELCLFCVASST